ncbi:TPA: hypothetical protein DDW69_02720 [candidate division CPR2 bacterium]|nr:MAG: hypothetical protein A2Y27_03115 [candidate division CPR2 bacterium GWD1_39_7]OGB70939.1 MAG: hypothetical protein A2Y26_05605 [candidate division CPR2 bacterium GWD2_39_7]HBG81734.1 hypothetical protein [candidate division CPR2 bacterium]HCM00094.1 hypothetical protein [candidate division CPR2 bacterium]
MMKKSKTTKKIDIINMLMISCLLFVLLLAAEIVFLGFFKKSPDPDPLNPPQSNKKVLDKLDEFNSLAN